MKKIEICKASLEASLEQLAAEQGVMPVGKLESILGRGDDLWDSDDDFDQFVSGINRRREDLGDPNS